MARKGYGKTVDKDTGEKRIKALLAELKRVPGGPHVKTGILADSGQHRDADGLTVVQVALFNEFGTDRIPARPFMRVSAAQLIPRMAVFQEKLLKAMAEGKMSLDTALDRMGLLVTAHIKKVIIDFERPPNAPSTILAKARKAGVQRIRAAGREGPEAKQVVLSLYDNPLVDTGQLLGSISYEKVR